MLVLNTNFAVEENLTRQTFINIILDWLTDSQYKDDAVISDLSRLDYEKETTTISNADSTFVLEINNFDDTFAVIVTNNEPDMICKTTYVLKDKQTPHMMACIQEKSATSTQSMPMLSKLKSVSLPKVMKSIFWDEMALDDGELPTDDKPKVLRKSDKDLAKSIIEQTIEANLPIVYISVGSNGRYSVNQEYIANELIGSAHTVIEGSPMVANAISEAIDPKAKKPYNGAIGIYFKNSEPMVYLPPEVKPKQEKPKPYYSDSFEMKIVNAVRKPSLSVAIKDEFNIERIKQHKLLSKLTAGDSELAQVFDEVLKDKDDEINTLKNQIDQMQAQLSEARDRLATSATKASNLEASFNKMSESESEDGMASARLKFNGPLIYNEEVVDTILRVLQKEYDAMKDDKELSKCRKFDIMEDVLEHNFPSETRAELCSVIKDATRDGYLSAEGIKSLQSNGFSVVKEGRDAHYRVSFSGFEKYACTHAATPSDSRGSKNFASTFINRLFGY